MARYDLVDAAYDAPGSPKIARSVVICSTPRSGSTLLAESLLSCGTFGTPMEYFDWEGSAAILRGRWLTQDFDAYVSALHAHRTASNGVFSLKIHWNQLVGAAQRASYKPNQAPLKNLLGRIAPNPVLVHITRDDRVAQAISLYRAATTNSWSSLSDHADDIEPPYSFAAIDGYVKALSAWEKNWEILLTTAHLPYATIRYEDLVGSEGPVVDEIARFAGIPQLGPASIAPRLRRQANEWSKETAARYRDDAGADSANRFTDG